MSMKTFVSGGANHYKMVIEDLKGNLITTTATLYFESSKEMYEHAHKIKNNGHYKLIMSGAETSLCIWLDEKVNQ